MLMPCHHLYFCTECYNEYNRREVNMKCPVCQTRVMWSEEVLFA